MRLLFLKTVVLVAASCATSAAIASTPDQWAKVDKASEAACLKAAKLTNAMVGPATRYSDRMLIDARVVEGNWPQPHMQGAKARMLCLYHRKSKRVEVQEMSEPLPPVAAVKDMWWRAEMIGGKAAIGSDVTMMLGTDGKVGGNSGCNGYGASYKLEAATLTVYPPMIGTMMACENPLMEQERSYRAILEKAALIRMAADGRLEIVSADGSIIRYVRK
jgi:heat shock protein HslJ